jgi:hypothetical protein
MPLTLVQIDAKLTSAHAALEAIISGQEAAFTSPSNRSVEFQNPDAIRRYIDWLEKQRADLVETTALDSGSTSAPVVRYQEVQL